ncbi:MarR family winged helix-turn-helix transcriptional regulator [Modestobacter sp. NPDC049651]|uniref:MarR family winged helix-turn-helix transcriptional regulator n=1 Tax=unclassified Modestobacter TaxID=2643866 RepID=UPI0033DC9E14
MPRSTPSRPDDTLAVTTGAGGDADPIGAGAAAYRVLQQVRPLYQAAGRAVDDALDGTELTMALRAVLELVLERGPLTVPQVAREFAITRQSVQALVDTGADRGLVELADNPQHRRSRLVTATGHGRRTFAEVHRRELANLDRVAGDLDSADLVRCAAVLATLTDRIRRLSDQDQELP